MRPRPGAYISEHRPNTGPAGDAGSSPERFVLTKPTLSVLIPCLNEQATIYGLLDAIGGQGYPLDRLETIVADGGSTDGTRKVIELYKTMYPEHKVVLVDNPARIIPAALNRAIEASTGEILMRLDGHSRPSPGYLDTCVQLVLEGRGDMVGGVWHIQPGNDSWQARSIAVAASHPAGVGDAYYRWATSAREVDTLAFWAFSRTWIERVGYFDETLLANEDYDFNSRFRAAGGRIWLDPSISCVYFARATFASLARQYWRYGYWKTKMVLRFPKTLRWRQFLPPSVLMAGLLLLLGGFLAAWLWSVLAVFTGAYALLLVAIGLIEAVRRSDALIALGMPLAIGIMHICWAAAFLWSFASGKRAR